MIIKKTFDEEHIRELQTKSRKDPALIERALYALGLLEALAQTGMPFIFKGGSCLMLLLPKIMRLSTDIDIVVDPGTDVDRYISEAAKIFPFVKYEEQMRKGKNNIVKRHFKFTYYSPTRKSNFYILLDVLFEENHYRKLLDREIKNELILTEGKDLIVKVPSTDCLLGDKFTAFAPYTTGIPLRSNKDLEVMKQYYDIGTLINEYSDFNDVLYTFKEIAASEIAYRGSNISIHDVLIDTIMAAATIGSKGKMGKDDYPLYLAGTRAVSTHIYGERYSNEVASIRSANVIYMAACLLTETPYKVITDYKDYINDPLIFSKLKPLSYIKKINPSQYAYLVEADRLLRLSK